MTMSCRCLVGVAVVMGQAGHPEEWIHEQNLSRSLNFLCIFLLEGAGSRDLLCPWLWSSAQGALSTHSPQLLAHTGTGPRSVTPALSSHLCHWARINPRDHGQMLLLGKKTSFPQARGEPPPGGHHPSRRSRHVQQDPRMLQHHQLWMRTDSAGPAPDPNPQLPRCSRVPGSGG